MSWRVGQFARRISRGISSAADDLAQDLAPYFVAPPAMVDPTHAQSQETVDEIERLLATKLPPELVSEIMNHAEAWAADTKQWDGEVGVSASSRAFSSRQRRDPQGQDQHDGLENDIGNLWLLVSEPLANDGAHFAHQVIVYTLSRDQGWASSGTYGTYHGSYSWFQLGLLRDGKEVPITYMRDGEERTETRCDVQHNIVAGQYYKEHTNVLDRSHPFVRAAREGDRFVLWARALYPGWCNYIRKSSLTVRTSRHAPAQELPLAPINSAPRLGDESESDEEHTDSDGTQWYDFEEMGESEGDASDGAEDDGDQT